MAAPWWCDRDGKTRHETRFAALMELMSLFRRRRKVSRAGRGKTRPYRCPACGSWHVGHYKPLNRKDAA